MYIGGGSLRSIIINKKLHHPFNKKKFHKLFHDLVGEFYFYTVTLILLENGFLSVASK